MALRNRLLGGESPDLAIDTVAHLLSNRRRRLVLDVLEDAELASLSELSESIADEEEADAGSKARKRVYIALHQCHLPKMDENNVIEYEEDRKVIHSGENYEGLLHAKEALEGVLR